MHDREQAPFDQGSDSPADGRPAHGIHVIRQLLLRRQPLPSRQHVGLDIGRDVLGYLLPHQGRPLTVNAVPPVIPRHPCNVDTT